VLERCLLVGQRAGDVEQEPARDDHRAAARDLGLDRCAQRELHVGGGELEASVGRIESDAAEDEHRRAARESTCDHPGPLGESVARNGHLQHIQGHGF